MGCYQRNAQLLIWLLISLILQSAQVFRHPACRCLPIYAKIAQANHQPIGTLMNEQFDEILTIEEVAAYLNAGRRTVYCLVASGQIPAFKLGGTWRFRRTELDSWIASRIGTQG
jgi:excisionase family DNA binding protein